MFNGFFVHHHFHDCSVNNVHHQNFDDWVSDDFLAGMSAAAFTIFWMKVANNILLYVVILNILQSDDKYLTKNEHEVQTESCDLCDFDFRNCGVNLLWSKPLFAGEA